MATFGVLDDVKLGLHNTFEKMRHKLQKNAAKMMASSSSNGSSSNENGCSSSKYDCYYPISQNETAPLDEHTNNNDIGLLPLERESSCLQDVLERNGSLCVTRRGSNNLVDAFSSKVTISKPTILPSSSRNSNNNEACLVDLNDDSGQKQQLFAPPPPVRSFSAIQQQKQQQQQPSSESDNNIHRSVSLSTNSSSSQGNDFFDVFSSNQKTENYGDSNFANFDEMAGTKQETNTLKPTPVGLFASNNGSNDLNKDPFASILGDFQPQQNTQNLPKPKVTLGDLAGNGTGPRLLLQPPAAPTSKPLTYNSSAPQLVTRAASMTTNNSSPPSSVQQPLLKQPSPASSISCKEGFNLFDDVFDQLGFSRQQNSNNNKTMRDMKKNQLARDLADDPEALKVRQWVDGKQGNIRALLSTLEEILWDDESRSKWDPIPIHQLVKISEVRKAYKRAVVVCHPDKLVGTRYERISRLVFIELNEASSEFQKELDQVGNNL